VEDVGPAEKENLAVMFGKGARAARVQKGVHENESKLKYFIG
jgi:hypothetical protein